MAFPRLCLTLLLWVLQGVTAKYSQPYLRVASLSSEEQNPDDFRLLFEEDLDFYESLLGFSYRSSLPPTPSLPSPSPSPTSGSCQDLLWSDEFDSSFQDSIWSYDLGANGWGNQELQNYTQDNVRVSDDGNLIIAVNGDSDTGSFTSGRIRTQDKLEVVYGNIEARIRMPTSLANGMWPAFWTLGANFEQVGWPSCGEMDIMEMGSAEAIASGTIHKRVSSAFHWENQGERVSYSLAATTPTNLNDGEFHVFRTEWNSTRVQTFVDDIRIIDFDITPEACTDCTEFHQPHFLLLNVAVGGDYTGILDASGITAPLPATMEVDYVRICNNGETRLSGSAIEDTVQYDFDCGSPATCTVDALNNYAGDTKCGDHIQNWMETGMTQQEACLTVAGTEFPAECGVCARQVLDCGVETCTDAALDTNAAGPTCRDRISFLIARNGVTEQQACNRVAGREHPSECGACNPIDCDQPTVCTPEAINADANGPTCLERIQFLISQGSSELEACKQVAGVEFSQECGACNVLDCNRPVTCTDAVLDRLAGEFSCRARISFLISSTGMSEEDACRQVAGVEFADACGPCYEKPLDCGVPDSCTLEVLENDADGFPCRDRIQFLMQSQPEEQACNQVAVVEFPDQCGGCAPPVLDCGVPDSCTSDVLENDADGFPCGNRIAFLMDSLNQSEEEACRQVAVVEFSDQCGGCAPPLSITRSNGE